MRVDDWGISKRDLKTLKVVSSDDPVAISNKARNDALGWTPHGMIGGGGLGMIALFPAAWPAIPGAIVGGALAYCIIRNHKANYYEQKKEAMKEW